MNQTNALAGLNVFLNPGSVAVIGASERPGSWGSFIMRGLLSANFSGHIYPVNSRADKVCGIPAFKDIGAIDAPVDLAVCAIPEKYVRETIEACGRKGVKGITKQLVLDTRGDEPTINTQITVEYLSTSATFRRMKSIVRDAVAGTAHVAYYIDNALLGVSD